MIDTLFSLGVFSKNVVLGRISYTAKIPLTDPASDFTANT